MRNTRARWKRRREWRARGCRVFCYIIEQNTERVESVSAWCPRCFPTRAGTESSEWNKCTWRKKKRSHVWIFHSVHPFNACFPLSVISHSSRERSSLIPEKKKKSSQSYCQFASLLLRLLGSSDLRLQRFNYYFFLLVYTRLAPWIPNKVYP